jgi:hypothetical protein
MNGISLYMRADKVIPLLLGAFPGATKAGLKAMLQRSKEWVPEHEVKEACKGPGEWWGFRIYDDSPPGLVGVVKLLAEQDARDN